MPQNPCYRPTGLKFNQITVINRGHGILEIGGQCYEISKGDSFFLKEGIPHAYYGTDNEFSTSWVTFIGDGVEPLLEYYGIDCNKISPLRTHGGFEKKLSELYRIFDTDISTPMLITKTIDTVVTYFDEAYTIELSVVEKIKNFLEANFAKPLTLDNILDGYSYSRSKLCKDFKNKYGETIFDMLTNIRLNNAQIQLESDTSLKVKDVAISCGFNDCSYFCRMYKRHFGKSPRKNI